MWNNLACSSYDICSTRRIAEAQRKHLLQLAASKSTIDTHKPWQPTYSLSKQANKYTHERNQKITHDNQVLLQKMMFIDKKAAGSDKMLEQSHTIKSMAGYLRKKNQETLLSQNNKIIERIESATKQSQYGKNVWVPESKKIEVYKSNILRNKQKTQGLDYTTLTKHFHPNDKFLIRKIPPSANYFGMKPQTSAGRIQGTQDDLDFQL